jgi:DHA2 family multidrug resistance protein-like MFS transporter
VASRLARRFSLRALIPAGLLLASSGFLLAAALGGDPTVLGLGVAAVLIGGGIGLSETIANDAILADVPADRAGSASAVSETAYELGAVLGTAVLGSVLTAVYRSAVVVPTSVGPLFANASRETLGGAVGVAQSLTGSDADALLTSARAAFVDGVWVTSLAGAAVLIAVAVAVTLGLHRR